MGAFFRVIFPCEAAEKKKKKKNLDSILPQREEGSPLGLAPGLPALLVLGKTTADRTGLLHTEVKWGVLEASVVLTKGTLLGLVDHGKHTSDVLAHNLNLRELGGSTAGHLGDTEGGKLRLGLGLLAQLVALHLGHGLVVVPM